MALLRELGWCGSEARTRSLEHTLTLGTTGARRQRGLRIDVCHRDRVAEVQRLDTYQATQIGQCRTQGGNCQMARRATTNKGCIVRQDGSRLFRIVYIIV